MPSTFTVAAYIARQESVEADAAAFFAHLRRSGVRFNARQKVEDATDYSLSVGGSSLAIPSKLVGTSKCQGALADTQRGREVVGQSFTPAVLAVIEDHRAGRDGLARIAVYAADGHLGFVADKHLGWLLPLLTPGLAGLVPFEESRVKVYVTAITGGVEGKSTRGCNIVVTGVAQAIRQHYASGEVSDDLRANESSIERAAMEAKRADAYEAGDRVKVEASTD